MFVGRDVELDELRRGLEESLNGRGRLFLVYGEPGIGKTRLCDELAVHAAALSVRLYWGRCWEAGAAPAYWPWLDVLSALTAELDPASLDAALGEGRAALATIVPALRVPGSPLPPDRPSEARLSLFRAASGLLRRVAASGRGLLLVLEDLHAADESSLLLLHFVARELRSMRVFLLVTFRDVEARLSAEVGEAIGRLTREGTSISLGRLTQSAAQQLLAARAAGLDPSAVSDVFRRTQGNPLFLQELAALLVSAAGAPLASGKLPASVREVLRERLGRAPDAARSLLEAAAIGGDDIDPLLLAAALNRPASDVLETLGSAEQAGVVVRRKGGQFGFFHALVREVLEHDLEAGRSQALHAAIAEALLSRGAASGEPPYFELVHHFLESPQQALPRAVDCAIRASDQALARFAFEDAIAVLERVRAAVERAGGGWQLRATVLVALGRAHIRRGTGTVGQAFCLEAAAIARERRDPELLARAALSYGLEIHAALIDRVLCGLLEEALARLPAEDTPLRVQVMARLAGALQPHPDLLYPIGLAQAAIAAARRIGEPDTLLYALHTGMSAMMDIVDPRVRLPLNLEAEQLAESLGDRERGLRSLVRLTFDHMELGELAAADARIAHLERLAQQANAGRYVWRVPLFRSMRAMMHGRFHESEELMQQAHESGTRIEDPQLARCYTFHHEGLLRAWERHEEMAEFDLTARPLRASFYSGPHWQNGGSAFTCARIEAVEQAHMYLDLIPQKDWPLVHNPPAFMHLGEPLAMCGARKLVQRVYDLLLPARERYLSWGFTKFIWDGSATRVLGLLATRLERYEEAEAHFSAAVDQLERLDARPYLARTRYEHGRALLTFGRAADRERALRSIEAARTSAERLDMRGLVRLAERQLSAAAGGSTGRTSSPGVPAPAVPRDAGARLGTPATPGRLEHPAPRADDPQLGAPGTPGGPAHAAPRADGAPSLASSPAPQASPIPSARAFAFLPEGEFWTVQHAAGSFRLRDSLGLHYLARLFAEPNRPIHVLELLTGDASAMGQALASGDAGELLDPQAVQSYRARARELEEELREAEAFRDVGRSAKLQEELEFLSAEVSRAVGLGGRARRAGSASERARSSVQRRVRNVLDRVRQCAPELGEFLERSVKTGTYCVYRPDDGP
jgi:tetratricopeptide (TPR) repeat protein